jgi:1-aminocyclopropane-1-carboxylate deaminase/D-cysteine desulfhydrase-like pyridoxal-dependent ACC family enzyme
MSSRPPDDDPTASRDIPLVRRFPALSHIRRLEIGHYPTPVESLDALAQSLWIKRDDLAGAPMGGNKLRALEFLLGDVAPDDLVATVGSEGSTHALAVATYGAALGARVRVGRWRQVMNPTAERVAARLARVAEEAPVFRTPVGAYWWAMRQRLHGARWIAAGGTTPLGMLGHVNAGLELVDQIDAKVLPAPHAVVVPLGTGGTAAGLALAFAIADRPIVVIGARVVPRVVARRSRVLRLTRRAASLVERVAGGALPRVHTDRIEIVHDYYGGAYGRETPDAKAAADRLRASRAIDLDPTYSAKAFALALARAARGPTLFWLTFDSRILDAS